MLLMPTVRNRRNTPDSGPRRSVDLDPTVTMVPSPTKAVSPRSGNSVSSMKEDYVNSDDEKE